MRIFLLSLSIIACLLTSCKSLAPVSIEGLSHQEVSGEELDQFLDGMMTQMNVPGLVLAIINDGVVVYKTTKGYANIETNIPVTQQTIFDGASLSKPVFAYMIMSLVESGLLDLDNPLYQYLDDGYPGIDHNDERFQKITARMVLSHTIGFPNWREGDELPINFEPGTQFSYSGEGYQYLVKVIESILNTDFRGIEAYFQEHVAKPLQMNTTKFVQDDYNLSHKAIPYMDGAPLSLEQLHEQRFGALHAIEYEEFGAAYAIHTNAEEYAKFMIGLMEGVGLSEESFNEMFNIQSSVPETNSLRRNFGVINWTLGFGKLVRGGETLFGHGGNNEGYSNLFLMDRDKKWGFVLFTNANQVNNIGPELFDYLNR